MNVKMVFNSQKGTENENERKKEKINTHNVSNREKNGGSILSDDA